MRDSVLMLTFCVLLIVPSASSQDIRGSEDHAMITRYPGQTIVRYDRKEFDEYNLVLGIEKTRPSQVQRLEGTVTRINYKNPQGRSTLEIYRNFESALKRAGAQVLFSCAAADCGVIATWYPVNGIRSMGASNENRYIASRVSRAGATVHISVFVATSYTQLDVIESAEMESGLVTVDAESLLEGIEREGHVAVYEILFDTGKAVLKSESHNVIGEIARMLKQQTQLKLHVVGHTDSTGTFESNIGLSVERANAVVQALVGQHGIAASRLGAHGVGPLAPVASNATEEGRAKNRRVELVAQ